MNQHAHKSDAFYGKETDRIMKLKCRDMNQNIQSLKSALTFETCKIGSNASCTILSEQHCSMCQKCGKDL